MKDIPRNELLDKLAAGWKVRRKQWGKGVALSKNGGIVSWDIYDLLADDWEGEPPGPALVCKSTCIMTAFEELRDGAAFIRRAAWKPAANPVMTIRNHLGNSHMLSTDDILATDWEVWN